MKFILTSLLLLALSTTRGQAKLVINDGGILTLQGGVNLLIENPDPSAITIMGVGTGHIVSEDENNLLIWSAGAGSGGAYLIPFGTASTYLPISVTISGGSSDGHFLFSTHPTTSWKNSDDLPLGVTNVSAGSTDNSAKVIDRFWQIRPIGFTTKPSLDNLVFNYTPADLAAPNSITEANLIAQRWNDVTHSWSDYFPPSLVNTSAHTVTVSHIPGNQLYSWWTLVDGSSPLPLTLLHFKAEVHGAAVLTSWQTASESNTSHFEVWRSKDGVNFESIGSIAAAGNSTALLDYSYPDKNPYRGKSDYRLKSVDLDGRFTWSNISQVEVGSPATINLYPNPASHAITLITPPEISARQTIASIYDAGGRKILSVQITTTNQLIDISPLASGVYHLSFRTDQNTHDLLFIKK